MTNKELIDKIRGEILHLKMKELQRTNGVNTGADVYLSSYAVLSILSNALTEESEDERIRKWLADYFSSIKKTVWVHRDITCEQILEWLEKQKEQKPAERNKATINGEPISTENQSVDIPLAGWSEEDEKMLSDLRNTLGCLMNTGAITFKTKKKFSNWLKSLRPSWKPSEQKYDGNMDKECIKLCDILNSVPSVETFESCCGHLKDRYSIWFFCNDIITISRLGRCVERNYSDGKWELLVDSTDTHPTGVFWLRSKIPFQSYDEMNKSVKELRNNIQYWFNTKFDSCFNGNTCK